MPRLDERVAVVEEANRQMVGRMDRLLGYMENGERWRSETGELLAVMNQKLNDSQVYQERCDADRVNLSKKVTSLDNFRKNTIRNATLVASFVALCFTSAIEWFRK